MTKDSEPRKRNIKRLWLAFAALLALVAALVVPPLVNVNRYRGRITGLMSSSLGRPVRLSSVGVRLLPWPAFVLTDLTVEEDPAYGAEPILHANSVTASIRLLSLWRGRLEIGSISVDEASLNLVRTSAGHWNLDSLFRSVAAAKSGPAAAAATSRRLPSIDATNSRINIKIGVEKLPFSLLSTDLSFWQPDPGQWRLRLRGQPARTDLSLDMADTGIVRLEARGQRAPELRRMPVHIDLEWREAQFGQLSRLLLGADPGWRGNLTGQFSLDGTPNAAQIRTRLRAEGVHRAEFAPAEALDFDANCSFLYRYTARALENLACDSPLGQGHIHIEGSLPPGTTPPHLSVALDRIPVEAGLDLLRTIRSGFGTGLQASGAISGSLVYAETAATPLKPAPARRHAPPGKAPAGPLSGSLAIEGFQLSGGTLSAPIRLPRTVFEPVTAPPGQPQALAATVSIPGDGGPLTVTTRLALSGYQLSVRGQAAIARAHELARAGDIKDAPLLDNLAGGPLTIDLTAEGPWLPVPWSAYSNVPFAGPMPPLGGYPPLVRRFDGTVTLHNATWKAPYLNNPVEIAQATLHLGQDELRWNPIAFAYGPVKGTASLVLPEDCGLVESCVPHFALQFDQLDAEALQAAILGARRRDTLLSTLLARLRLSSPPVWPRTEGVVSAGSLLLGPVTLHGVSAALRTTASGVQIASLDAALLGGRLHASGTIEPGDKPAYTFKADFEALRPADVGRLLGLRASGKSIDAGGKIQVSGYTAQDLAASVSGSFHFDWRHGAIAASGPDAVPPPLVRFDRWTGDASIGNGAVAIRQDLVQRDARKQAVEATLRLAAPLRLTFPNQPPMKR